MNDVTNVNACIFAKCRKENKNTKLIMEDTKKLDSLEQNKQLHKNNKLKSLEVFLDNNKLLCVNG